MKFHQMLFIFSMIATGPLAAMQTNAIILADSQEFQGKDTRFCCPYCFDKFYFKQIFLSHLMTHNEVARLGVPIPGHHPSFTLYNLAEAVFQRTHVLTHNSH